MDERKTNNPVYSQKIKSGKRTYFFEVNSSRSGDYYITITESKRRYNGRGYDKHKIYLYKEDFNKFYNSLESAVNHVKNELLPDYDYGEYDRSLGELQQNEKATAPIKLYFDLDEYSKDEIADGISFLSELYRSVGGDKLIIDDIKIGEVINDLEPLILV